MKIYFIIIFTLLFTLTLKSQLPTIDFSFDPNPQNDFIFDKGTNIWNMNNFVYVVNGYVNTIGGRSQQIFKINADNKQIIKQISLEGPNGDISISERGGFCITSDNYILLTGEWNNLIEQKVCTFLAKIDKDLNTIWINYYPDLSNSFLYGDGIAELPTGEYLLYLTNKIDNPTQPDENIIRLVKTDIDGNLIYNKTLQDNYLSTNGFGSIAVASDGNILLSSIVVDFLNHPTKPFNNLLFKIDSDANNIWSRTMENFVPLILQDAISTPLLGGGCAIMAAKDTSSTNYNINPTFIVMYGYDSNGQKIWSHEWNDIATRTVSRIVTASNGDILGVGYYSKGGNKGKGWLFRINSDGEVIWEKHYSDSLLRPWSPQFELLDICEMEDGRIAATGIVYDTSALGTINANVEVLIVNSDGCLTSNCSGLLQELTDTNESILSMSNLLTIEISPNPTSDFCYLSLSNLETLKLQDKDIRIYNNNGVLIRQINWNFSQSEINIETKNWDTGLYHAIIYSQNYPVASGKIIKKHD
jgi:Secretion system C-terminal sorting domain